jgi:hypothetical protein
VRPAARATRLSSATGCRRAVRPTSSRPLATCAAPQTWRATCPRCATACRKSAPPTLWRRQAHCVARRALAAVILTNGATA